MKTSDFDYELPPQHIAQTPVEPRDSARLMVLDRSETEIAQARFSDIGDYLRPEDLLVVNRSRVIPARLAARKLATGGKVEVLLLERVGVTAWKALVGGRGLGIGKRVELSNGLRGEIVEAKEGPLRVLRFEEPLDDTLETIGQTPLPPYVHEPLADPERYQTVYAKEPGSAAAPTAGLHFTPQLLRELEERGIGLVEALLHIGLDTFAPVNEEDPQRHRIHSEWCSLGPNAAAKINQTKQNGGRVIAVGTTSVRVLESAAQGSEVKPFEGPTSLFILPGHTFRAVDAMITNFHLPRSTLLMLVSAFAGRERVLAAYQAAIAEGYRFYSFGDAMLIV